MDAKEWAKMADMIAQIRRKLWDVQAHNENYDTEVTLKVQMVREFLAITLEHIDTLARYDDLGWIR
jgi:hypothetical protein